MILILRSFYYYDKPIYYPLKFSTFYKMRMNLEKKQFSYFYKLDTFCSKSRVRLRIRRLWVHIPSSAPDLPPIFQ